MKRKVQMFWSLFGLSMIALAADWITTMHAVNMHWKCGRRALIEGNPFLGMAPASTTVTCYFGAFFIANVTCALTLNHKVRWVLPVLLSVIEIYITCGNVLVFHRLCG